MAAMPAWPDEPWSREIRLADPEVHDVHALGREGLDGPADGSRRGG